ncbi:hypothetical protein IQ06DRAFT_185427, partial [Phaeosphaeriaceae sp. SRC1lsM3a]
MSWDLNLCMESFDKAVVPFHYYVKPKPQLNPPTLCSFPFLRLPVDLQLIVYEHCDLPTLFQLMQTCSYSRRATTKLFWDTTFLNQWYHCPDYWLFEHPDDTFTISPYCPEFARQITNIEIDLIRLELRFREDGEDRDEQFRASTVMKAKIFWAKVERVFPSARRIVLTGCTPTQPDPPPPGASDEEYACIETVLEHAAAHIKVYVAFIAYPSIEREEPPRNTLWQVPCRSQSAWRVLDPDWKPIRVLLPHRRWPVSPLGDFQMFNQRFHSAILEMRGIEWLMIESYARYAVNGVIHCPHLDCAETFATRSLWKRHLYAGGHRQFDIRLQSKGNPMHQLLCYKHTPEIEKRAIETRQRRLDAMYLEAKKIQRRVGYGWGPPRSEQRKLF